MTKPGRRMCTSSRRCTSGRCTGWLIGANTVVTAGHCVHQGGGGSFYPTSSYRIYPGRNGPIASARLEQIRDGIEDWSVFDLVRRKRGAAAVRTILANAGLFSATAQGVKLACTFGCELKSTTAYSWPQFSHDTSTARSRLIGP